MEFAFMNNKQFAYQLEKRTRQFSINIIKLTSRLPNLPEAKIIRYQLAKSGTAVGANYREANRSRSRKDFRSRCKLCESEASESQYWLEIIACMGWITRDVLNPVHRECSEILAIFTSINRKL